jgi:hypothetical protein
MYWSPQPGPQVLASTCPADEILFGGSRGGGKSDATIGRHLLGAQKWGRKWNGLIVRRKYKDLNELRHRWDEIIASGLPAERVGGEQQTNYIRFTNGAQVSLMAFQRIEQADDIQGHQYPEISLDECTNFPWFNKLIDKVSGANRSPHGIPTHIFCTGNPGGPGHLQVKEYFKLGTPTGKNCNVWKSELDSGKSISRVYIQSFLKDNQILCKNDPKYAARLMSIKDPILRKAWLDGDWDVYIGQAFNITPRHIVPAAPPPPHVAIYMTFDWGFSAPFSVGWWWVDPSTDRICRFNEWYGWNGVPNEGLRIVDSAIADGIIEREHKMGITGRSIIRIAGPDCWNKKADYRGGGQGPPTAEIFRDQGLVMRPGDPSRHLKIRAFRERLLLPDDPGEQPKMVIGANCTQFLRTIPALAMGNDDPEYIDEDQEEHVFDEACHIVMARAKSSPYEISFRESDLAAKKEQRKTIPKSHATVWGELDKIREQLDENYDI